MTIIARQSVRATAYRAVNAHRQCPRRTYATPLGSGTSVDARWGIQPPPPPQAAGEASSSSSSSSQSSFIVHPRPDNPNDLSDLLRDLGSRQQSGSSSSSSSSSRSKQGTLHSVKGTAIPNGSHRRTTGVPTDDLPLMPGEAGASDPVNATPVDREHPHSIDSLRGRNELDERVLNAARGVHASGKGLGLKQLGQLFEQEAGRVLPIELPYESAPADNRKVPVPRRDPASHLPPEVTEDDGVLLLAYVEDVTAPRGKEKISVCTGFAVEGGQELSQAVEGEEQGHLVVTVAHTLRSAFAAKARSGADKEGEDRSAAIAITRNGHVYPIQTLLSSLPSSDLVLLRIAKEPLAVGESSSSSSSQPSASAPKTLPISPYPSPANSHLLVSSFWGFEDDSSCSLPPFSYSPTSSPPLTLLPSSSSSPAGRSPAQVKREGDAMTQSRWGEVRLVEYRDGKGSEAQTGTYDSLETMEYKLVRDSPINPAVLRGAGPSMAFVPGHGSSGASSNDGSLSTTAAGTSTRNDISSSSASARGVPNFPPPGSSGGPIVDAQTGAVVGVTRGCKMSTVGGRRGEGIPSEKICEFFTLPGMGAKVKGSAKK